MICDELLNLAEVGRRLGGICVKSVRRIIASGALKAVRVLSKLMVPASELQAYIDRLKGNGDATT